MLDVWHHVIHIQDRLLSSDIYLRIAWENDNPIDGDIVTEYELPQRLDVPVILPEGVPQLMFQGKTVSLVTSIRQILLPELCISATIYLPVDIFGLYHENTVAGDNNMVNLCGVITVANQKVIVNPVIIAVQIRQE